MSMSQSAIFKSLGIFYEKNILLRVVCDTMLQGLCKKLRMFGVDAVALGKTSYFHHFVECGSASF
jgi:hypothetical protein